MPDFDIDTVYTWDVFEVSATLVEFTVYTVNGAVSGIISEEDAQALSDRLLTQYPGPYYAEGRSMTE